MILFFVIPNLVRDLRSLGMVELFDDHSGNPEGEFRDIGDDE
jgi:hypothetical protein